MAPRTRPTAPRDPHVVGAVVADGVSPFELSVACEAFGIDRHYLADPWYRLLLCAVDPPPIATAVPGMSIDTPHRLADLAQADTILVPIWDPERTPSPALVAALRAALDRGARIVSFCSGAFLLAHAGILTGRRATTHWIYTERFAAAFPEVELDPEVLYVVDGPVMTSAGTAAAIDLSLHIVRADHGPEVASLLARRMVVPPHRDGGQAQFVQAPVPTCDVADPFRATLDWAVEHLDEPLTVEVLARRAAVSPRTFARRFVAVTGTTPNRWLTTQRVLHAQRLLEGTDESIDRIAERCGFGSAAGLRGPFQRQVGTTPSAYRATFQVPAPA